MKELPKVYASPINKEFNNYQKSYRSDSIADKNSSLDDILKNRPYIYKVELIIETKDGTFTDRIALKRNDYILTMSNKKINIADIINVKEKK